MCFLPITACGGEQDDAFHLQPLVTGIDNEY